MYVSVYKVNLYLFIAEILYVDKLFPKIIVNLIF